MLRYEEAPLGDYVDCPLLNDEEIPSSDYFLMSTVAEGITPKVCIEERFLQKENFVEICMNCKNHRI